MTIHERFWLAGLLEGEGCFFLLKFKSKPKWRGSPVVSLKMTDRDVVATAAALMGAPSVKEEPRGDGRKLMYASVVSGPKAASIMREVRPLMGDRRGAKIDEVLAAWGPDEDLRKRKRA